MNIFYYDTGIKDFTFGILRQLLDGSKPRDEKIILTRYACERMKEHGLDIETLEDIFRVARKKETKLFKDICKRYRRSL